MMLKLLVIVGVLGVSLADKPDKCGPLQILSVKRQWEHVYGVDTNREKFATAVWKHFFHDHPDRSLFGNVRGDNIYSPEFRAHMVRVFAGLDILVSVLDDDKVFDKAADHYKAFHKQFGGVPFEQFGKTILYIMPDFLDIVLDEAAWEVCYARIVKAMS